MSNFKAWLSLIAGDNPNLRKTVNSVRAGITKGRVDKEGNYYSKADVIENNKRVAIRKRYNATVKKKREDKEFEELKARSKHPVYRNAKEFEKVLYKALKKMDSPLATRSAVLAEEAMKLQKADLDPRLSYGIGVKETNALKYPPSQPINNAWGIGPGKKFNTIDDGAKYFTNLLLNSPYYEDYRNTKDYYDLLKRYTPVSDPRNPAMQTQLEHLRSIMNDLR